MNEKYVNAVIQELNVIRNQNQNATTTTTSPTIQLQSIYFGGGTPSLAPVQSIARIMDSIKKIFILSQGIEITMEMDPGTFYQKQLQALNCMLAHGSFWDSNC